MVKVIETGVGRTKKRYSASPQKLLSVLQSFQFLFLVLSTVLAASISSSHLINSPSISKDQEREEENVTSSPVSSVSLVPKASTSYLLFYPLNYPSMVLPSHSSPSPPLIYSPNFSPLSLSSSSSSRSIAL